MPSALLTYLEAHYAGTPGSYLVAVPSMQTAVPIILATGLPVMAMGGLTGSDPALSLTTLEQLTSSGKLKYFLLSGGGMGGPGGGGNAEVLGGGVAAGL
ncbi:MAG: hypothetical protein IRZ10_09545 [Thermoflavifilum sp.]|nr:hypothetical protein [Thermoflavifilum sp.]MCL6514650.1 hypothetical protein [Alicyclobacillus sp.]